MNYLPLIALAVLVACSPPVVKRNYTWYQCVTYYEMSSNVRNCPTLD